MTASNNEWEKQFSDNLFKIGKRYQERFENAKGYYPHFWTEKKVCEELEKMVSSLLAQTRQDTVREVIEILDKNYKYFRESKSGGMEWQLGALSIIYDDIVSLGEGYGIKDE